MPGSTDNNHETHSRLSVTKHNTLMAESAKTSSPRLTHPISPPRKLSISAAGQPRRTLDTPQPIKSYKATTTTPRAYAATPKLPSPSQEPSRSRETACTFRKPSLSPNTGQQRKISATTKLISPPRTSRPRKPSATPKSASPPRPDWIAPPGKYCTPPSTQIPLPTFISSARKECLSPLQVRGLTPDAQTIREGVVKMSSPLVYKLEDWDDAATVSTEENSNGGVRLSVKWAGTKDEKTELKGLGFKFKDPFPLTVGPGFGFGSGSHVSEITSPSMGDATSPASPVSPSLRVYTPTLAITKDKARQAEDNPKRDSLSPVFSKTVTFIPPTPLPIFPQTILSRMPHHLSPSLTTTSHPRSPKQTHPYTSNTHITPSCTYGALTHRLDCGHLILTLKVEVCGRNCVYRDTDEGWDRGDGEGKIEQGFVANLRDLDDMWVCPCCGNGGGMGVEKGKRGKKCVSVLNTDKSGCSGSRG